MLNTCSFKLQQLLVALQFTSLVAIPVGITSSAVGIKICAITAGIKKYKSIIKKKKKHYKIVFLGNDRLYTIEVLISNFMMNLFQ